MQQEDQELRIDPQSSHKSVKHRNGQSGKCRIHADIYQFNITFDYHQERQQRDPHYDREKCFGDKTVTDGINNVAFSVRSGMAGGIDVTDISHFRSPPTLCKSLRQKAPDLRPELSCSTASATEGKDGALLCLSERSGSFR